MSRNPYAPPTASSLELPNPAQSWGRVGLLVPSLGTAGIVTAGLGIIGAINSGQVMALRFIVGLFVAYWFALALVLVVGLLFRYLAQHWYLGQVWVAITTGTVVGCLSVLAIDFILRSVPELSVIHVPRIAYLQFGVVGAAAGFVFWTLAKRRLRPNKSLGRAHEG
jgi:uncharacterized membrane protein